jgi:hypothetical protein
VTGSRGPGFSRNGAWQVAKAEKAVAAKVPVKRNGFIRLHGGIRTVNRELEATARAGRDQGLHHEHREPDCGVS